MKGEAAIDWADRPARTALLAKIVADADRLLELSRQAQGELPKDGEERRQNYWGSCCSRTWNGLRAESASRTGEPGPDDVGA